MSGRLTSLRLVRNMGSRISVVAILVTIVDDGKWLG
jgi:hypothetical protein